MERVVDIQNAIKGCTQPTCKLWGVKIDGRIYVNRKGRVLWNRKCDVTNSLRWSPLYYTIRPLAYNHIEVFKITDRKQIEAIKEKYWESFLKRCEYFTVTI